MVAKVLNRPSYVVLTGIEHEILVANHHRLLRDNDDKRKKEIMRTDALVLSDADFAKHERRVKLLNHEYKELLQLLEVAQRARGGALPPPLRLHRSES